MTKDSRAPDRTYITNVERAAQVLSEARVLVEEGPDAPREVTVPPRGLTIGLDPSSDLQLSDRRVSRSHAHIMVERAAFRVRDLGSSNGTLVDGVRVTDALAPPGTT